MIPIPPARTLIQAAFVSARFAGIMPAWPLEPATWLVRQMLRALSARTCVPNRAWQGTEITTRCGEDVLGSRGDSSSTLSTQGGRPGCRPRPISRHDRAGGDSISRCQTS
jgi:hypothetical protein